MDLHADERPSDSPFVESIWRSGPSDSGGSFISMAESHCAIVVTKIRDQYTLTVRGPETRATAAAGPPDAEFFGILLKPGVYLPRHPAKMLMDRSDVNLPEAGIRRFWLNGSAWQFPNFDNADTFVNWLVRDGLLVHDNIVEAVMRGHPLDMSVRTVQRRFLQATGLTYGTIAQIERARLAAALLKSGVSILDTVYQAGYADQPHLTRSLKVLVGLTPAQIISENRTERLSFLYRSNYNLPGVWNFQPAMPFLQPAQPQFERAALLLTP